MQRQGFWVFGYGSLLWNPGFEFVERRLATLKGLHRSFCMASVHYRGTPQAPGLVLALETKAAGECRGVGFRVGEEQAEQVLAYLRERELVSAAYLEQWHPIRFHDGGVAEALCYVIDRDHEQYRGGLSLREQADIIAAAAGKTGPNSTYLLNTVEHLAELGIADQEMETLAEMVRGGAVTPPGGL